MRIFAVILQHQIAHPWDRACTAFRLMLDERRCAVTSATAVVVSPLAVFLITVAVAALALTPAFVPQEKIDAFGARVHDAGTRGRQLVKKSLPSVGTLLLVAIAVSSVGRLNPGDLARLESRHHGFAQVLYVIELVLAGIFGVLIASAILLAAALSALWVLALVLATLPTGSRAMALAFFILAVGVALVLYLLS